ncbi:MAG: imidazolonepropionase [Thermoleophilia bacterium]
MSHESTSAAAALVAADVVIRNAGELVTCADGLGIVPNGAVAAAAGRITWVGPDAALHEAVDIGPDCRVIDAGGRVVMPGVVECHTHVVFGGDRAAEFQMRVAGRSYQEIAAAGGGIKSTVGATRAASSAELFARGLRHLDRLLAYGVTTVEVKSGYGLTVDHELRILEVYRELADAVPQTVVPTLLGAHTVPAEYAGRSDRYVDLVVGEMIPAAAERGLARFCDVFVEEGAFDLDQARRVLEAGAAHGLRPKLHVDQLSAGGGAELAAELGAVSADHLDHVSDAGIDALAAAGVTAVLLPGAVFFLGLHEYAPARRLLEAGVRVALSTDFNPGTCYTENVFLMGTIASTQMKMDVTEVTLGLTLNAAHAVGMAHEVGSLEVGKRADILILDSANHLSIPYHWGVNPVTVVMKDGMVVAERTRERCDEGEMTR